MRLAASSPATDVDDVGGLAPHRRVVAVQERHRPVAPAHETVGAEGVDGHLDGLAKVPTVPRRCRKHRIEARDLRDDVAEVGGAANQRRPFGHSLALERRLAQMVDHDRQVGEASCELGNVTEMARKDAGKLEHEPVLLNDREALENVVLQDPMGVALLVNKVTDTPQLGLAFERIQPGAGALGRAQIHPGCDCADPRVRRSPARTSRPCPRPCSWPARESSCRCRRRRGADEDRPVRRSGRSPRARVASTALAPARDSRSADGSRRSR